MTRQELIKSPGYVLGKAQIDLFHLVQAFMKEKGTSEPETARLLGISEGSLNEILFGDFDGKASEYIEIVDKCGRVAQITYV
jgi:hypothetical protein